MICENCKSPLHYRDKYCNICGEKIDKSIYDEEYNKTIWGKFDKFSDWWETASLKKFTDNFIVKIIVLVAVFLCAYLGISHKYNSIMILENDYKIEYNQTLDEYYIRTHKEEALLNFHIPKRTEKILIKEFDEKTSINEKSILAENEEAKSIIIKKSDLKYISVEAITKDKVIDCIKVYITE